MEKRIFILIGFLLLSFSIYAQDDFLPGKIYLENGSVLEGLVESKIWNRNPEKINFKTQSETTVYKFNELKRVEVGNFIFEKAAIKYEVSSINTKQLTDSPILEFALDTVLLRVVAEGPKSLLTYLTQSGKPQFYIKHSNDYILLEHRYYLYNQSGELSIRENKRYVNQLAGLLTDCSNLTAEFANLNYNQESLEKLFKRYYQCIDFKPKFYLEKEKIKLSWGVLGGFTSTSLLGIGNFYGTDANSSKDYSKSFAPTAGAFIETSIRGTNEQLSLHLDALFTFYKIEGEPNKYAFFDPNGVPITFIGKREIEQIHLKFYPGLLYKLKSDNLVFHIKAGLGAGFALRTKSSVEINGLYFEKDPLLTTSSFDFGFVFGVGLNVDRIILSTNLERKSSGLDPNGLARLNRLIVTLGYRINK